MISPTKLIEIEGVQFITLESYVPKHDKLDDFDHCCGAGKIGDRLVPDRILGLKISVCCDIHDHAFDVLPATWEAFHGASYRFVTNIYSLIKARSNWGMGFARTILAAVYFYSVDTAGARSFQRTKRRQGFEVT